MSDIAVRALATARQQYRDRNVESFRFQEQAAAVMPGGNTRTVLHNPPFPLTFVHGAGAVLTDADGHSYLDFLGDYTAGLLGHSDPASLDAVITALHANTSVGGRHPAEVRLAELMCERFHLDLVRFTNSGTEANLMAITAARLFTRRPTIMVMENGYHGGVLYFGKEPAAWSAPYPTVMVPFNDGPAVRQAAARHVGDLAAIIVDPLMGSAGCVPAAREFLATVIEAAHEVGAMVIFDEVMTSRHGPHGMGDLLGAQPDLTTFGKYIGAGFSFGAFGGRADIMAMFDPSGPSPVSHAGTFNNNVASMTAGVEVLGHSYTSADAVAHTARGDDFRGNIATMLTRRHLPIVVSGFGSMMTIIARRDMPTDGVQAADRDSVLQELLYLGLLERGISIAARGMVNLGLRHTDDHLAAFLTALDDCCADLAQISPLGVGD